MKFMLECFQYFKKKYRIVRLKTWGEAYSFYAW